MFTEFNQNKTHIDRLQANCKICQAAYTAKHYQNNKTIYKSRAKERTIAARIWLSQYKQGKSCSRCDETHPACLQFHHIDPTVKEGELAKAATNGWAIERIKEEISKCIILCANCHFKEHWNPA